jgi:hypothetical protein
MSLGLPAEVNLVMWTVNTHRKFQGGDRIVVLRFAMLCVCVCLLLVGCSHDIQSSAVYQPGDGKALFAMGIVTPEIGHEFLLQRFDPATKKVLGSDDVNVTAGNEYFRRIDTMMHHVVAIKPGDYVISRVTYGHGLTVYIDHLCHGTLEFTIKPDVVNYIGDFRLNRDVGVQFASRNPGALSEYLVKELPNVKIPIESTASRITTYGDPDYCKPN